MADQSNTPSTEFSSRPEPGAGAPGGRPSPAREQAREVDGPAQPGVRQDLEAGKEHVRRDVEHAKQHVKQDVKQGAGRVKERLKRSAKRKAKGAGRSVKSRAEGAAEAQKGRAAQKMHEASDRIERRAQSMEQQGGVKARAGRAARRTGAALDQSADYLRTHRIATIRDDVEGRIRQHPLLTVGAALGSGYMLGSMFGGEDEDERDAEHGHDHHDHDAYRADPPRRSSRSRMMDRVKGPLGKAVMSGVTAMVAKKLNERVQDRQQTKM